MKRLNAQQGKCKDPRRKFSEASEIEHCQIVVDERYEHRYVNDSNHQDESGVRKELCPIA